MPVPLLTVCVITYNHARFVEQAIESVLAQKATFAWNVLIADDASTDGTRVIVERIAQRQPRRVRALLRSKNVGPAENFRQLIMGPSSRYIAYIEGDDLWLDPLKLQEQVDLLERDPDAAGCYTNAIVVDSDGTTIAADYFAHFGKTPVARVRTADIVPFGISPASTLCFRAAVLAHAPDWFTTTLRHSGLDLLITLHGNLRYLETKTAAYRVHPGGSWSMTPQHERMMSDLRFLRALYLDDHLRGRFGGEIRSALRAELAALTADAPAHLAWSEVGRFLTSLVLQPPRDASFAHAVGRALARQALGRTWRRLRAVAGR